ncbi:MAG: hypothetical protein KKA84_00335 [Bacteroidetes bacterium]|nr:hypothetical protein [Bacteroidota bacterium]
MNLASIDIGSNTVLLLIAEFHENQKNFTPLLNLYKSPRLGKGIQSDGNISEESLVKLYDVLDEYKSIIDEYKCDIVLAKATNAMRIAKNSANIIESVKTKYNIDIEVLPGMEEARISYLGAASALSHEEEKLVIDIGGGSTEIIYGKGETIAYRNSFPIGAVNLTEKFVKGEIIVDNEIIEMNNFLEDFFSELLSSVPKSIPAIAVAGTPTTLSCMKQSLKEYNEESVENAILNKVDLELLIEELKKLYPSEILKYYGPVVAGREDVILAGTIILNSLSKMLSIDSYTVSAKGIRYGALIDYLQKNSYL